MTARVFIWDYRQQPDLAAIFAFITELGGGKVTIHAREVDIWSDEYAWVISDRDLSEDEAMELYAREIGDV